MRRDETSVRGMLDCVARQVMCRTRCLDERRDRASCHNCCKICRQQCLLGQPCREGDCFGCWR